MYFGQSVYYDYNTSKAIHQIGMFRYLCKGGYIQGDRSINREVLSSKTLFRAGDVLSCVDNLRLFTSSTISTLVVILTNNGDENENIKLAMEGVSSNNLPKVIKRDKSSQAEAGIPIDADGTHQPVNVQVGRCLWPY